MGAEVPSLGGISRIGGESRGARQSRDRNAVSRPKDPRSAFEASADPLYVAETPIEIAAQPEAEVGALPMGTANGLTLDDVKAAYEAS